jgi:hypothetical protein
MKQMIGTDWRFHPSYKSREVQDRLIKALNEMALAWIARSGEIISRKIKADLTKLSVGIEAGPTGVHENGHEVWLLTHAVFEWGDRIPNHVLIIVGPRDCIKKYAAVFNEGLARISQETHTRTYEP